MPMQRGLYRRLLALACPAALVATLACALPSQARDEPTWRDLLKIITGQESALPGGTAEPYNEWESMPEINPTTGKAIDLVQSVVEQPHADWVAIYMNPPAVGSLAEDYPTYVGRNEPDELFQMRHGSICLKENYKSGPTPPPTDSDIAHRDARLESLTILWKVEGYDNGQPLELVNPDGTKNPVADAYLAGGEWFYGMFPGCCFQQKPSGGKVPPCPNDAWGNPAACKPLILATQPFMRSPHTNRPTQFATNVGEIVAGKAWFCQGCHNGATGVGRMKYRSFGDYVWRMSPWEVDPPPVSER